MAVDDALSRFAVAVAWLHYCFPTDFRETSQAKIHIVFLSTPGALPLLLRITATTETARQTMPGFTLEWQLTLAPLPPL